MNRLKQLPVVLGDRLRGTLYGAAFLIAICSLWELGLANAYEGRGMGEAGRPAHVATSRPDAVAAVDYAEAAGDVDVDLDQ